MKVLCRPLRLRLAHPFRISHGVSDERANVLVEIGSQGWGEAACVPYRAETPEAVQRYVSALRLPPSPTPQAVREALAALPPGPASARAAVDSALHDLLSRLEGRPLSELLGVASVEGAPPTCYTVARAEPEQMASLARAAPAGVGPRKLKLGGPDDLRCVQAVRAATPAALVADANGGWTCDQALAILPELARLGVQLVEQPLAPGDRDGLLRLRALRERPPIYLDESVQSLPDLEGAARYAEGVVIKLAKAGGLRSALLQIQRARQLGLGVMVGCMVESSLGILAAAHLAPLADWVDLDGPLLLAAQPFVAPPLLEGRWQLPDRPGWGLVWASATPPEA